MRSGVTGSILLFSIQALGCWLLAGTDRTPDHSGPSDAFFSNGIIPQLRIELDAGALASLRQDSHRYVKATVTEGDTVYREVGLHLKGGLASFRPLDDRPCLTLNFDKFARGQK